MCDLLGDIIDYIADLKSDMNKSDFGRHHPGNISMDTNMAGNTIQSQKQTAQHLSAAYSFFYGPTLIGKGPNLLFQIKNRLGILEDVQLFGYYKLLENRVSSKDQSRGGMDAKPGTTVPPVGPGIRPRPIKPSRPGSPGQTSKPFWSNGKPKCKKGFRYDFKRKLCVKIK